MKQLVNILAGLALAFLLVAPTLAADQCFTYEDTIKVITDKGGAVQPIDPTQLPDFLAKVSTISGQVVTDLGVTRAFLASQGGVIYVGLEKDGCLLPPIILTPAKTKDAGPGQHNGLTKA